MSNNEQRGIIRNPAHKQRIADFSGLKVGNITPTDIDAFMDFGNRLFVFIEAKYGEAELPLGQRIALERLCDASQKPPERIAIAFITRYDNPEGDINFANTSVTKYRWKGKWRVPISADTTLVSALTTWREMAMPSVAAQ